MLRRIILLLFILIYPASAAINVANYTFDQGTGIYANDSSGFNNNGTITGATWTTDSVNGTALLFSGTNQYVNVPQSVTLNRTSTGAITFWIKPLGTGTQAIVSKGNLDGFNDAYNVLLQDSPLPLSTILDLRKSTGGNALVQDIGPELTINKTDFIVALWNGTYLEIYKNGVLSGTILQPFDVIPNVDPLTICTTSTGNFDCHAILDEIRLYDTYINMSNINEIYQQFQPVPAYPTGAMVISATYPPQTTSVNFSWHDTEYPGDRLQVALDSSFNVIVVDITTSDDFYLATLNSGDTYYWRVRQYNGATNVYGKTSQIENFSITSASSATGQGVQGVVYELINGLVTPIDQAQVYIYNATYSNFMVTGSNGYYLFDNLANGTYQVYAVKQDYDTTAALPVNVSGNLATQDILMKKFISPYIPNFVYEKFIVRGLFDNSYSGVTVNVYVGDELTISQTGTTDTMGQAVFRLFKDQQYRVVFTGGGIGSDITVHIYAKEESYYVRVMSGFPTGGDRNSDISSNLTSIAINATWSNLSLVYNDTLNSSSLVWLYAKNLSTNVTCYQSATNTSVITLGCPVVAAGKYQFGFNATSSVYGFFKQDKVINFDVGKPDTPAITTNINKTLLQWASIILIVLTAALFSVKTVKFGAAIVPLEALVFWAFGWFEPIPGGAVLTNFTLLACAVCLGIMVYLRQSETKAVYQ